MLATAIPSSPVRPLAAQPALGTSPEVSLAADAMSAVAQYMADSQVLEEMAAAYLAADELARESSEQEAEQKEKANSALSMQVFPEQWGMSQFWNDDATARTLADECIRQANGGTIVLISSPSVFLALKKMGVPNRLLLLEFDSRFAVFPEFRSYDYNRPHNVGNLTRAQIKNIRAAVVILDPPYINEDCFSKTATTVRALSTPDTKIIASTGWKVRDTVRDVLGGHMVKLRPGHSCGLATAFRVYVNYEGEGVYEADPDPENGDNDGTAFAGAGGVEAA